jgi:RibD C-terminal domain
VRIAKEAADGGDVVVLGANVAQQCLDAGLLDEIIIHVAPVLVGDGVRLFDRAGGAAVKLTPISSADEAALLAATGRRGPLGHVIRAAESRDPLRHECPRMGGRRRLNACSR